ncbi:MAG TPA: hypothetical protein VLS93_05485 [Anaeromyxobacteraceae bacterium]|nr:hypothetical protein [Anaeromyxobacteraceae bacterium]
MDGPILDDLVLYGPLLVLGFAAGAIRTLARRPGLPERRGRTLTALWVALLLVGAPAWILVATAVAG